MLPGVAEAAAVAQVGGSVMHGIQKANQPLPWPNVREALLELHAILGEWCMRAKSTSDYVEAVLHGGIDSELIMGTNIGWGQSVGTRDLQIVLESKAPWFKRWQASSRRQAARRSLRTILSVYAPEFLEEFEQAIQDRVSWLGLLHDDLDVWVHVHTEEEVAQLIKDMDTTQRRLIDAESSLRKFILENFSLSDI